MESLKEVNKGTRLSRSSKMKAEGNLMALSTRGEKIITEKRALYVNEQWCQKTKCKQTDYE